MVVKVNHFCNVCNIYGMSNSLYDNTVSIFATSCNWLRVYKKVEGLQWS